MPHVEVPVLVVGAGPVGLTASLLLTRHGVRHLVVDRRSGPHRAPQAHVVNPRSLEIFRQLDVDTKALRRLATPRKDGGYVSWVTTLAGAELGRLPYERQDDDVLAITPEPIINLSQHQLEPMLLERAARSPLATIRWTHEWTGMATDDHGVTSTITGQDGDDAYDVRSRWVLAADGAGSPIRKRLGIPMVGPERLQSFVMIHFEADLRALVRDRPAIIYWTVDPETLGSFIAHDIDRTWVFMHPYDPEVEAAETFDTSRCGTIVRRAIGRDDVALTVRDVSPWHMTSQVAERYRSGRVFLVGDSAHRFPPAGGMGMNTGIQDVHNLVWKLRYVDEGWAGEALLDTYDTERRPVARENADQSLSNALRMIEMLGALGLDGDAKASRERLTRLASSAEGRERLRGAIAGQRDHFDMLGLQLGFAYPTGAVVPDGTPPVTRTVSDPMPNARPGSRIPHAWIERAGRRISSFDLLSADAFTLIGGPAADPTPWPATGTTPPVRVLIAGRDFSDPGEAWLRACGLRPEGMLLVRPDQHVAWRSHAPRTGAGAALRETLLRQP